MRGVRGASVFCRLGAGLALPAGWNGLGPDGLAAAFACGVALLSACDGSTMQCHTHAS